MNNVVLVFVLSVVLLGWAAGCSSEPTTPPPSSSPRQLPKLPPGVKVPNPQQPIPPR